MIELATIYNARVYFNLNKRNFEQCSLQCARLILEYIVNKNYKSTKNAFDKVCGKYSAEINKIWIIDIDDTNQNPDEIINFINNKCEPFNIKSKYITTIPTKNGYHLITRPFNINKFKDNYSDINIHKNNPSLLFTP